MSNYLRKLCRNVIMNDLTLKQCEIAICDMKSF